jgi:hypothetical protein
MNWLLRLFIPHWEALIENPATGKPSAKSLFAAVGFMVGIGLVVIGALADIREHRIMEKTGVMLLLANGLGLQALKAWQAQANRETATAEGQPLAVPGTNPPEPMPQVTNPNAPANAEETGAPPQHQEASAGQSPTT